MSIPARRVLLSVLAVVLGLAAYVAATAGRGAPAAHAAGTVVVHVKQASLTENGCDGQLISGGHFVINQITSPPASISVSLSDGTTLTVPLTHQTQKVAQYTVTFTPGLTIVDATADVPSDWSGQFVLSNYLCGGPTPSTSPPPSTSQPPSSSSAPAPPSSGMPS